MNRISGWVGAVALFFVSSCAAGDGVERPPEGTDFVKVSNGGAFSGGRETTIFFANDVALTHGESPFGEKRRDTWVALQPGSYARLRAVAKRDLPAVARNATREVCNDYGGDLVSVSPPVGGLDRVSATCPDKGILALQKAIATAAAE